MKKLLIMALMITTVNAFAGKLPDGIAPSLMNKFAIDFLILKISTPYTIIKQGNLKKMQDDQELLLGYDIVKIDNSCRLVGSFVEAGSCSALDNCSVWGINNPLDNCLTNLSQQTIKDLLFSPFLIK